MSRLFTQQRICGFLYLGVVLTGIFHLGYIPSRFIVADDPVAMSKRIADSTYLFQLGIIVGFICYVFFAFLALAMYKYLKVVNDRYALIMATLVLISIPIACLNLQNLLSMVTMVEEKNNDGLIIYLNNYRNGLRIVQAFWGLWLFPCGMLIYKSGFIPKIFGITLMLGSAGYIFNFIGKIFYPNDLGNPVFFYASLPASIGEISFCLFLMIANGKRC